jgi:hypothetical protein
MRQVPEETSGCAREGTRQKPDEPGEAEEEGQEEMRVTTAGKNRIAIYDPKTVLFGALRPHRRCWHSGPDLGERWPSRLVATAEEKRLSFRRNFIHEIFGSD